MIHRENHRSGLTATELLKTPITYDIVVSDFGRDATIEYAQEVYDI